MRIALWTLQILLARLLPVPLHTLVAPVTRTPSARDEVRPGDARRAAIVRRHSRGLAGIALVLPPLIRVLTWLTPLAAAGLVVLMLGAIVFHLMRREYPNVGLNAVLALLAAIVAWGRFGPYHF